MLRLASLTRDGIEGLAEQMAPTSLMAVQNRMALDMLLAEKGGVCATFGDVCCTFIPNNTAPDGSVTRALEGLKTLKTMHEHSGVNNFGGVDDFGVRAVERIYFVNYGFFGYIYCNFGNLWLLLCTLHSIPGN